jgi:histidyl-tRNA synthetase
VARAYIEAGLWQPGAVSRLYTMGPMFRYERPQKGRQRQFHQINAELIGPVEPQADAELILMLDGFLKAIGLEKLTIELNSLGCPECRPRFKHALREFFAGIDAAGLCEDCRRRKDSNPLRVLDCKVPGCKALTQGAPSILDHLCDHCVPHFEAVKDILSRAGLPYSLNPRLVRGLDYYQRTTFEVVSHDIGSQTAVAGGGRYDGLYKQLGGPDVPAVGFACGMERLALLLGEREAPRPDFFVAVLDERGESEAVLLAQALRAKGFTGEVAYSSGSMKSRLRQADKSRARNCLILGGSEVEARTVTIKDMAGGGGQKTVPWSDVTNSLY